MDGVCVRKAKAPASLLLPRWGFSFFTARTSGYVLPPAKWVWVATRAAASATGAIRAENKSDDWVTRKDALSPVRSQVVAKNVFFKKKTGIATTRQVLLPTNIFGREQNSSRRLIAYS